jgi:hypothetical protein
LAPPGREINIMKPNADTESVKTKTIVLVAPVRCAASRKITHGMTSNRSAMKMRNEDSKKTCERVTASMGKNSQVNSPIGGRFQPLLPETPRQY